MIQYFEEQLKSNPTAVYYLLEKTIVPNTTDIFATISISMHKANVVDITTIELLENLIYVRQSTKFPVFCQEI